jgi:hypothetical protein
MVRSIVCSHEKESVVINGSPMLRKDIGYHVASMEAAARSRLLLVPVMDPKREDAVHANGEKRATREAMNSSSLG